MPFTLELKCAVVFWTEIVKFLQVNLYEGENAIYMWKVD